MAAPYLSRYPSVRFPPNMTALSSSSKHHMFVQIPLQYLHNFSPQTASMQGLQQRNSVPYATPMDHQPSSASSVQSLNCGQLSLLHRANHLPAVPKVSSSVDSLMQNIPQNPENWTNFDVLSWLKWCAKEYNLDNLAFSRFNLNGKALCILSKDSFLSRCPNYGDILFELLAVIRRRWQQLCISFTSLNHQTVTRHIPPPPMLVPDNKLEMRKSSLPGSSSSLLHPERDEFAIESKMTAGPPPRISLEGIHMQSVANLGYHRRESAGNTLQHIAGNEQLWTDSVVSASQNLTHPFHNSDKTAPRLLWLFIYQLLSDQTRRYQGIIQWIDSSQLTFQIIDPNAVAKLWGGLKNRDNMTYEKMSRALRYYYKMNIIQKEPGKKLTYRFLCDPEHMQNALKASGRRYKTTLGCPKWTSSSSSSSSSENIAEIKSQDSGSSGESSKNSNGDFQSSGSESDIEDANDDSEVENLDIKKLECEKSLPEESDVSNHICSSGGSSSSESDNVSSNNDTEHNSNRYKMPPKKRLIANHLLEERKKPSDV